MVKPVLRSQKSSQNMCLYVQVYQGPALQCESMFALGRSAKVKIGKSRSSHLHIPYAPFPTDVALFRITRWGVKVRLDPRFDGFVSDSQRFGSVRDFTAPRGALKELASVLEPLEVDLPADSRGALQISGYTIVFRVGRAKPPVVLRHVRGAPKAPFDLPYGQTGLEKSGILLGLLTSLAIFIPAASWLNRAAITEFRKMSDMSPYVAAEIFHPDHFRLLPWVFGPEFDPGKITVQAIRWVNELKNKWQAEESGQRFESDVPVLRGASVPGDMFALRRRWQEDYENRWAEVEQRKNAAAPGTFLRGQDKYSSFRIVVAGGERGSIAERVRAHFDRLDRTYTAAISMIETEHEYMKKHFATFNAQIPVIFDAPKEPGLFYRLPEDAFRLEKKNFSDAESFSALARKKQKRFAAHADSGLKASAQPFVWSSDSLASANILAPSTVSAIGGSEDQLFKNARLAVGMIAPPPAPKPVPYINMSEVEAYVRSRSPEVKVCYDVALTRNPTLAGSILWRWKIDERGRMIKSGVEKASIKDNQFIECLSKKIKGWSFPKPVNGAISITFPFRFAVRENQ